MGDDQNRAKSKRRDPAYVRKQREAKVVEPPKELPMAEATEATTIEDTLSEETRKAVEDFLGDQGITASTEELENELPKDEAQARERAEAEIAQLKAENGKLKAPKVPKVPKEPKEPKAPREPKTLARDQEGHCRVCGKLLTQEKSVIRGIGPVCYAAMMRQMNWSKETAAFHVENDTDEEWNQLIANVRELLYKPAVELTEVPEGYVEMSKFCDEAEKAGLTRGAAASACGGDRAAKEALGPQFVPVYVMIGLRARKFVPGEAIASLHLIQEAQKPRVLTGAAKATKEKSLAKSA